jgi:hypothetical protein
MSQGHARSPVHASPDLRRPALRIRRPQGSPGSVPTLICAVVMPAIAVTQQAPAMVSRRYTAHSASLSMTSRLINYCIFPKF